MSRRLLEEYLEGDPPRKLNDARVSRAGDLPEETARDARTRAAEFRVVEDIERFYPDFQLHPFPKNWCCLG